MIDQELIIPGVKLESTNVSIKNVSVGARMASASKAKGQRTGVAMMCLTKFGVAPSPPLTITITRVGPRELDGDNLQGSAKHARDGVSDWLGVNDRDKRLRWEYRQESQGMKVYAVKIRVQTRVLTFEEMLALDKAYQLLVKKTAKARALLCFAGMKIGSRQAKWNKALKAQEDQWALVKMCWEAQNGIV